MTRYLTPLIILLMFAITASCRKPPLPPPTVIFDQAHNQRFFIDNSGALDLSKLSNIFKKQGLMVKSSRTPITKRLLTNVAALIISGPFKEISPDEISALKEFLNAGGQLVIMLHIAQPADNLLKSLGVAVSNGVVHEQRNLLAPGSDTNFYVSDLAPHPLTKGLARINLYGAWALNTRLEANVIAKTSTSAWIDLNHDQILDRGDAVQAFSEVVRGQLGHGRFIVFADDAIFQNKFLVGPNEALAVNMAKWLKKGSYYPHP